MRLSSVSESLYLELTPSCRPSYTIYSTSAKPGRVPRCKLHRHSEERGLRKFILCREGGIVNLDASTPHLVGPRASQHR
ncbi:hypothetical protein BaRGS_00011109 [Batillaria attramentaria]|uniref:Uncharacterized protein n=1 Tax=Batillaria attramentaria TaxID=370345 RepID=A0ABD0LDT7_9CAEN